MKRVLVVGPPGAGKSTFAATLSERKGLPVIHLDQEYWQAGWKTPNQDDWDRKLRRMCEDASWVMDGNHPRTLPMRVSYADTLILMNTPFYICIGRLVKRQWRYFGQTRPTIADGCEERIDFSIVKKLFVYFSSGRKTITKIALNKKLRFIELRNNDDQRALFEELT